MRALVTGGAGFIGSHVAEELLLHGNSVRVLDNFSSGKRENLENLKGELEIIEGDLRDRVLVKTAVEGIDFVFHLGAFVSVPQSMQEPDNCFDINVGGTNNLLGASRNAGVRKVVISSSTAVYGDTETFPTGEDTPLAPLSPYALSKQVNELYACLYTKSFNLQVTCLRYFNVYGPRQRPDSDYAAAIPIFLRHLLNNEAITIFGNGHQSRDFIFVKDVVKANLLAAEASSSGGIYNICTGKETSLLDLVEVLSGLSSSMPPVIFGSPRKGDIFRSVGDPTKAGDKLNFHSETSLADGLAQTLKWMRSQ